MENKDKPTSRFFTVFTVPPDARPYRDRDIIYSGRCLRSARWYAENSVNASGLSRWVMFPDGHLEEVR